MPVATAFYKLHFSDGTVFSLRNAALGLEDEESARLQQRSKETCVPRRLTALENRVTKLAATLYNMEPMGEC